ncbi:MAG: hypothetical protein ACI81S_002328 [Sphingobacteriales bacterium]|jgi:hypothetical protein
MIFSLVGLISIIEGCCADPPQPFEYDVRSVEIVNFDINTSSKIEQDSIPIRLGNYGINLNSITARIAENKPQAPLFVSAAMAMNCNYDREFIAKNRVVEVNFWTLTDFDEMHPKGSNVYDLFEGFILKESCGAAGGGFFDCSSTVGEFDTEEQFIEVLNQELILNDFLNFQTSNRNRFNILKLKSLPEKPYQQFSIQIIMDDENVYNDTTSIIKLIP